jgi:hypothetical protein
MLRAGLGNLAHNFLIISAYGGRKQLYVYSNNPPKPLSVSGISIESKWNLNPHTYVLAEVAQSFSVDGKKTPATAVKFFSLNDKSNKALSLKLRSAVPKWQLMGEAAYKYTGANFQSFSSYQNNSNLVSWYVKAEKFLLKRLFKINAALRSNDYSNPYVVQNYSSTSVFKSVQFSFRKKKWPVITAGYIPASQLTMVDNTVYENRFYTFNASIGHTYKVGAQRGATTFVFNRFNNKASDSGYLYFNAVNFYLNQTVFFNAFSAAVNASHSRNNNYELNVLDEQFNIPLLKTADITLGVRINNFNKKYNKLAGYGSFHWRIGGQSALHLSYDQSYFPGYSNSLVRSDFFNIGYTQAFGK